MATPLEPFHWSLVIPSMHTAVIVELQLSPRNQLTMQSSSLTTNGHGGCVVRIVLGHCEPIEEKTEEGILQSSELIRVQELLPDWTYVTVLRLWENA